ncbi:MAG: MFS transporter [Paracoccaceae bacterium]
MEFTRFLKNNARWLAAGALLTLVSSFGQTFFISIFAGQIREEFGLSNGAWGGIYSLATAASAIVMVWAGGLSDHLRVRQLGALIMAGTVLAALAMAFASSVWALVLVVFALRFCGQGMSTHLATVAMARWFVATRGMALAIASLGFALGEAFLPVITVALMGVVYWRLLWGGAALIVLLLIPLLVHLLKQERTPATIANETPSTGMAGRHWTRRDLLGHWLFWMMVPALLAPPAFVTALFFQQVHLAAVKGWSHTALVALIPIYTATGVAAALVFGWMIDRFGSIRLMPFYQAPLALGFVLFSLAQTPLGGGVAMAVMAVTQGGQSTLSSAFWAEIYGTRHLGGIKALAAGVMVLGSAIGPALTGVLIDAGVNFDVQMLWISGYILAASGLVLFAVGRARRALSPPL